MTEPRKGTDLPSAAAYSRAMARTALTGYSGKISTSRWEFMLVAVALLVLQVLHDDDARIRLNKLADLHADKAKQAALQEQVQREGEA